ncbi:MAG: chromosome segregation protein SMC [Bdellovibrionales bacterium]|nr:chromosome segregation protein SMC [Bdellovibrionales bacterium]
MRVKRLEVQGFKSFKDKTVVHFDHNITGIVGPNGCGKSNVVDAFFWVMGEQSHKHIRAGGSDDLIFNGSSKYSPSAIAEATLVLETDYVDTENAPAGATVKDLPLHLRTKEIAVTRRVYRGGEGEYLINGITARLKDIHELFMDTGVGAKGYSIIAQGEIQKIVNAKPEDRRVLIEEAAGIAKYKARKKESIRKMESAQANLSRLNDVVAEIERTLNSLERQAQKASQYKKHKEELLAKEMTWGRRKNRVLRARLDELKAKREALEQELVGLKAELSTADMSIESDRVEQLTLSKSTEELQSKISEMSGDLTRAQSALDLSRRRQSDLAMQTEALTAEKSDLETSIVAEKENITGLNAENESAAADLAAASANANAKEEIVRALRSETETARRDLDHAKREMMNGVTKSSDLASRIAALESKAESANAQIERLNQQAAVLAEKVSAASEESARVMDASASARAKKDRLHAEARAIGEAVESHEQALKAARRELEDANRNLTKSRSKLQSLEELAAALEGFGDGPRRVLDWAKENGKDSGLRALAEGLDIEAGYESAVEGFLEGKLETLVTEDAASAIEALGSLAGGSNGRAGILIASETASGASVDATNVGAVESALSAAGFSVVGPLASFVKPNAKLSSANAAAAIRMLGSAIVVESMAPLPAFLAGNSPSVLNGPLGSLSIVAKDGSAFDADGVLRGGAVSNDRQASVLGRKKTIEALTTEVAALETSFAAMETRVSEMTEALETERARQAAIRLDVQSAEIEFATIERDVQTAVRQAKDLASQSELVEYELTEMRTEAEEAIAEKAKSADEMAAIAANRSSLETKIGELESKVVALEASLREGEEGLSELKIIEAGRKERAGSVKRELDAGLALISDRERRLAEVARQLVRVEAETEEHSGGDEEFIVKIEDLTRKLADERELLAGMRDRLEVVSAKVGGALDRIKELHGDADEKTAAVNTCSLDIERLTGDLSHLVLNLEEKYGPGCLDLPEAAPVLEENGETIVSVEMTAEEEQILGEEVERLREKIRRLGDVNPTAVEEYEEKKKRFDYLMTEKNDLLKSIDDLNEAIDHINRTSEERFRKAYDAIADRFERLFPIIFGGGQSKLSLVYPEGSTDILEAGIDILAQPPGKKVVNIGLLSGGEKALTAVSLIFAIFMVKPSPFCILDEVDAPLDDANIGKFNALLREMSSKSQFIIITHNKKTMELNDTLYGVTMEEPGVSKMVSIELH